MALNQYGQMVTSTPLHPSNPFNTGGKGSLTQDSSSDPNALAASQAAYQAFHKQHPDLYAAYLKSLPSPTTGWAAWKSFVYATLGVLGAAAGASFLGGAADAATSAAATNTIDST